MAQQHHHENLSPAHFANSVVYTVYSGYTHFCTKPPATGFPLLYREHYFFCQRDGTRCAQCYLVDSCGNEHLVATARKGAQGRSKALVCVPEPAFDWALPLASCVIARKDGVQRWMQQVKQLPLCSKVRYAVFLLVCCCLVYR